MRTPPRTAIAAALLAVGLAACAAPGLYPWGPQPSAGTAPKAGTIVLTPRTSPAGTLGFHALKGGGDGLAAYLAQKRSPIQKVGRAVYASSERYDIDPGLIGAIAGAETSFGRKVCAPFNAWNWFHGGSCPASPFAGFEEGGQTVAKFLRKTYLNRLKLTTVPLIAKRYCVTGCEHWIPNVTQFMGEISRLRAGSRA